MTSVLELLRGELIGRYVKAVQKDNEHKFEGKIIDETKNTVVLKSKTCRKRLVKERFSFEFSGGICIDGSYFTKRPKSRIKTRLKNGKN